MTAQVNFGSTITLLFTDIRGFTEYTEEQGDETAFRMLRKHNEVIRSEIERTGGREVKTQGDSFMVSFTTARAAVLCAVSIQSSLSEARDPETGGPIRVGIGINTGEPVQEEGDYFGGMVNLAARICAAAGAGEILISETTRQVVGRMEGLDFADRGKHELKGIAEKLNLYSVVPSGGAAPATRTRVAWLPIVGVVALACAALAIFVRGLPEKPEPRELLFRMVPENGATEMNVSPPESVSFETDYVDFEVEPGGFAVVQPYGVSLGDFALELEAEVLEGDGYFGPQFHVGQRGYHALRILPERKQAWLTLAPYGPHPVEAEERLATAEIEPAGRYKLSVQSIDDRLAVQLNGQTLIEVTDDGLGVGSLEFAVGSFGKPFRVRLLSMEVER